MTRIKTSSHVVLIRITVGMKTKEKLIAIKKWDMTIINVGQNTVMCHITYAHK
jgi:hypothetical protein